MIKIINFIKNKWLFLLIITIIFFLLFVYATTSNQNNIKEIKVTDTNIANIEGVRPGLLFEEDRINQTFGTQLSATSSGNVEIRDYPSSNIYRNNQIEVSNNKIGFIREIVNQEDNKTDNDIKNVYGNPSNILYPKTSDSSFNLYIYTDNGIAYLGHVDGTILEIWYFEPTDIETFMSKYAQSYQETPFEGQISH
ncbi:MAG: hypothetical protein WA152_02025 [Microgenomates group bacterium]